MISYTWGWHEQEVIKKLKATTILSVAYKWLGEKTKVIACDNQSEKRMLFKLHKLLDKADVIIAHNGNSFDRKKINYRFIVHKIPPPSPYKIIDTKVQAKSIAAFDSNRLNEIGLDLGEGEKIKHRGIEMWEGCMAGKKRDWTEMKRYNKKDVDLLERIYLRLRPWITNHPVLGLLDGTYKKNKCRSCGSENSGPRGWVYNKTGKRRRYRCHDCTTWF